MFSKSRNDLRDHDNTAGIGDDAAGIGDNSAGIAITSQKSAMTLQGSAILPRKCPHAKLRPEC